MRTRACARHWHSQRHSQRCCRRRRRESIAQLVQTKLIPQIPTRSPLLQLLTAMPSLRMGLLHHTCMPAARTLELQPTQRMQLVERLGAVAEWRTASAAAMLCAGSALSQLQQVQLHVLLQHLQLWLLLKARRTLHVQRFAEHRRL